MNTGDSPQIYIHAGTVKTGSTYIQKTFYQNARVFESFGVSYPYVFPPALDLPRYANAEFLVNRSRDDDAGRLLRDPRFPKKLISDEGIFFNLSQLNHPAFEGLPTRVILYVRRPAELILSWASELSRPYNAFFPEAIFGLGIRDIPTGVRILSDIYENATKRFIEFVTASPSRDIVVRAFESASFINHNLLSDFIGCLDLKENEVLAHPDFVDPGVTNEGSPRKYCDISYLAWLFLGKPDRPYPYDESLVAEIVNNCESGDRRPAIETAEDEVIGEITERFAFFEQFLSERFLGGAPVFDQRYPSVYGTTREPYYPIDRREVKLLTELILLRREIAKVDSAIDIAMRYGSDAAIRPESENPEIRRGQRLTNDIVSTRTPLFDDTGPEVDRVVPRPNQALLEADISKALNIVDRILSATNDEIESRKFLLDRFYEYGIPKMTPTFFKPWERHMNESGFGAIQVPTEYIDCLRTLISLNIKTAIEIGVYRGGFSYFTAAVLQRVCPDFRMILVDPWDSLLGFDRFSKKLNLQKAIPATSDDFAGQSFEFVLIDGDHTYEAAIKDFHNLGVHASKAMGFHDIHDHSPGVGTVRTWNEIKAQMCETHEVYEFAHAVERGLGIGMVVNPNAVKLRPKS
jgi:hypothetical protein